MILFYALLILHLVFLIIAAYNFFTAPRFKGAPLFEKPFISVLIPARNEEKNIGECLDSLTAQSYENMEIIVLDDCSSDNTYKTALRYEPQGVIIKKGSALPVDWLGKNWACKQLSEYAAGDIFLFIDADVRLDKKAIEIALSMKKHYEAQALSVFPYQEVKTWGERLIVPIMNWILLTFLPLRQVALSANPAFAAANGQFIMFDKSIYNITGGHESVKNKITEDVELCRAIKRTGYKFLTAAGNENVSCRMYGSFREGFSGFSKNFFPGSGMPAPLFMLFLFFILFAFLSPVFLSIYMSEFLIIAGILAAQRALVSIISGQNIIMNILLHPFQMAMVFGIGINSLYAHYKKGTAWKGRVYKKSGAISTF